MANASKWESGGYDDPDDGTGRVNRIEVTNEWKEFKIDLDFFSKHSPHRSALDLSKLSVVAEFVFHVTWLVGSCLLLGHVLGACVNHLDCKLIACLLAGRVKDC